MSRSLRVPCPRGRELPHFQMSLELVDEECPDDVETVRVPSPAGNGDLAEGAGALARGGDAPCRIPGRRCRTP